MSWEADMDAMLANVPSTGPAKERRRPFDVQRGMMEESLGKIAKTKTGIAEMAKIYESKTGKSGEFAHGPMSTIRKMALGKGRKTRRSTSKRLRGRSRYASGATRKGKN